MSNSDETERASPVAPKASVRFINEPPPKGAPKTVIVLGCGRGGTSAISGMLRELGVAFPAVTHPLKHESSPIAYAPDGSVRQEETQRQISAMDALHPIWGWKSPGDLYRLESFRTYLRNICFVIIFRNMADIVASASHHEDVPFRVSAPHVGSVHNELGRLIGLATEPMAIVNYEHLLKNSAKVARDLAKWLDLPASKAQLEAAARFTDGKQPGYRALGSYEGGAKSGFATAELAQDRAALHAAIYPGLIKELELRARTLQTDNLGAVEVERWLTNRLRTALQALPDGEMDPEAAAKLPLEAFDRYVGAAAPAKAAAAPPAPAPVARSAQEATDDADLTAEYERAWSSYVEAQKSRQQTQRVINDLARKLERFPKPDAPPS